LPVRSSHSIRRTAMYEFHRPSQRRAVKIADSPNR
jgi:hypothetical protein